MYIKNDELFYIFCYLEFYRSRLGCQIQVDEEMEGTVVKLPDETQNYMD